MDSSFLNNLEADNRKLKQEFAKLSELLLQQKGIINKDHTKTKELEDKVTKIENRLISTITSKGTEREIALPEHLYTTWCTLKKIGEKATSEEIASVTHKSRAVESGYLNQLVILEVCKKYHIHRKVYFEMK